MKNSWKLIHPSCKTIKLVNAKVTNLKSKKKFCSRWEWLIRVSDLGIFDFHAAFIPVFYELVQFSISKLCNSLFEATFSVVVRTNVHRIVHTSLVPSWKIVIHKSPADSMGIKKFWHQISNSKPLKLEIFSLIFTNVNLNFSAKNSPVHYT